MIWNKAAIQRVITAAQKGLMKGTTEIYNYAQRITPFDDGELVLGARTSSEGEGTDTFTTAVSYGNNNVSAEYAVIQHENLQYRHRAPEQNQFLRKAFDDLAPTIPQFVADEIRKVAG